MRRAVRRLGRHALDAELPWAEQRRRLARLGDAARLPRGTVVAHRELGGVPAEAVTTRPGRPDRVVVHFHGGGYCVGSAATARVWAAHLSAAAACTVILPEYRLAPEHPHPAALEDARTVVNALRDQAGGGLVLSGDSAGAGLALALAVALRDGGEPMPAGCVLLSPWLDLTADRAAGRELARRDVMLTPRWLDACARAYADRSRWSDPAVSPLLAPHHGLPPLLIQAGADDVLAPDAARLAASASAGGVEVTYTVWPRMWHDFALQPGMLAAADSALDQAAWFVTTVTGRPRGWGAWGSNPEPTD